MRVVLDEKLHICEGREVEVCYKENDVKRYEDTYLKGVWYKAIVEKEVKPAPRKRKFSILTVRLLKDDFATPLTELSDKAFFRPVPPDRLNARDKIKEGCVVDAYYRDGWWTGFVVKEIKDDKCLVLFDSSPDIIEFEIKHLRSHLDWVDKISWIVPKSGHFWRLTKDSIFSSGTMVEMSSKLLGSMEFFWVPAMVIKEIKMGDGEKKYIVKLSDTKQNIVTVASRCVRPTPPPFLVEEYKLLDSVEAFHGSKWRKGIVKRIIVQKQYMVSLKATKKQLKFNHSDLRLPMGWEDGVWKTKDSPLAQESGNGMDDSVMNANESASSVTPSRVVTATPLKQTEAETQGKNQNGLANDSTRENESNTDNNRTRKREDNTDNVEETTKATPLKQEEVETQGKAPHPVRNQNGLANDSTRENESSESNNRKRKREENTANAEETTKANDTTMCLPFAKKLPIWKRFETMTAFKTIPESPHFRPLVYTSENSREVSAVGLMLTFSGLLEEIKNLQFSTPTVKLWSFIHQVTRTSRGKIQTEALS